MDGVGVGGVEGEGYHGLLLAQVNFDYAVVVSHVAGTEFAVVFGTVVYLVVVLDLVVGHPDGAEAGCLGGHDVDAVAEVDGEVLDAGACEFEHFVLDETVVEHGLNERDGHVVGADALLGSAFEPYEDNLGSVDVPGVAQELLHEFAAAFAHTHVAERAVAGVRVGTENHVAALDHSLAGVLVDYGLVGGHVDTAVFLGGGETEHMVVFIDGTAYGAEGVVAVGHGVGEGEFLQAGGACCLYDAHVGDVVAHHGVEADAHLVALRAVYVMGAKYAVSDCVLAGFVGGGEPGGVGGKFLAVEQIYSFVNEFYHGRCLEIRFIWLL